MEINGLPLHPLVVHAAVIFGPLAAARRARSTPGPVAGATAALADGRSSAVVAARVGRRGVLHRQRLPGQQARARAARRRSRPTRTAGPAAAGVTLGFAVVALAPGWLHAAPGRAPRSCCRSCSSVAAVAMLVLVVLTGDAGARAVWADRQPLTSTSARCARRAAAGTTRPAPGRPSPARDGLVEPALRLVVAVGAAARAVLGHLVEVGERLDQVLRLRRGPGRTSGCPGVSTIQPSPSGQREHERRGGGVPAAAGDGVDDARRRGRRRAPAR